MKIALVHDWLNQIGGAENVLEALVELYPGAPVYTAMYSPERMPDFYREWDIRTTWMDRLPGIYAHHQKYLPLYPLAWGGVDLSDYDLVLSNKSGFCHGVQTGDALHICYCLAPTPWCSRTRPASPTARKPVTRCISATAPRRRATCGSSSITSRGRGSLRRQRRRSSRSSDGCGAGTTPPHSASITLLPSRRRSASGSRVSTTGTQRLSSRLSRSTASSQPQTTTTTS